MTPNVMTRPRTRTNLELLRELRSRLARCEHEYAAAAAAGEFLAGEVPHAVVSIYAYDAPAGEVRVLWSSPDCSRSGAVGARSRPGADTLGRALRAGTAQRVRDVYVEPDFVRSLPGQTRSEVVVPVLCAGEAVGAIRLEYSLPHQPTEQDEELAELAALHLTLRRSAEPAGAVASPDRSSARRAELLAGLARTLAQSADVPAAMTSAAEAAREGLGAESAVLLLRHGSRQMLEVAAAAGSPAPAVGELIPLDSGVAGEAVRSSRTRGAALGPDQRFCSADAALGLRDTLVAPLCSGGRTVGAIAVLNRLAGGTPAPEEVELLQSIADVAGALDPMRQIAPLRQRLSDNSLIAEVGRAVTGTLGLDEVLGLVVRAAEMLLGARGVALGLLAPGDTVLSLAATGGCLRGMQGATVPLHGSLLGLAVLEGEVVTSDCVSEDPRAAHPEVRQGPGVIVPLESRATIHGALLAARAEGAPAISDEDVDALRKLVSYAAIAIDNAKLYREQTELSRALRQQTEKLEEAYGELRDSQERLVVSEKMAALGRLTAGIAHEINSPLGGILNCLLLAQQYAGEYRDSIGDPEVGPDDHTAIAGDLLNAIQMAESATRKVGQFVRTIKGQTRTGDDEQRHPFDPAEEIRGILALLQHQLRDRKVELHTELEEGLELVGSPGQFALLVQNLVSNAIDAYEDEGGTVQVRVHRDTAEIVLEVEDAGCGIPEAIRSRIFDYLFTTKDVGQGTGLGLSMVHSIVTTHFLGRIELRSEVGSGSTFSIRLPTSRTES